MNLEMVLGLVRHLLTFGGGSLVTGGYLTDGDLTSGVGAVATLIGIAWSVYMKFKSKKGS